MRDRKKRNITIISLCCLLVFMAVGYAVLSQTLNIDGTANLTGEWNIYIESITATKENGNAISKSAIVSEDKLSAEFLVELEKPGDYVEYNVVVTNGGNIDASLRELITEETNPHKDIKFSHTAKQGEVLTQKTSTEFTVKVEFDRNATTVTPGEIATYKIRLNYEQYEGNQLYAPPKVDTDNSCFKINAEGTITDYDESCGTYVTVPKEIDGITVKKLGQFSFSKYNAEIFVESSGSITCMTYDYETYQLALGLIPNMAGEQEVNVYYKEDLSRQEYDEIITNLEGSNKLPICLMSDGTLLTGGKPYIEYLDLSLATEITELESQALGGGSYNGSEGECIVNNPLKRVEFGENSSINILGEYNFVCLNMEEMTIPKSVTVYDPSDLGNGNTFDEAFIKELTVGEGITRIEVPLDTQKLIVPSTVQSISDISIYPTKDVKEVIFMHRTKPSFYGDTSWYDPSVTTVTYPNID